MTAQNEIINDSRYVPIHNGGFVGLIDHMGSDQSIEQAARVSYSKGTRQTQDTRNLLRYLMRHLHTSPFEMAQTQWHVRLPIFVARQWIRHRTGSCNETSLRYSEANDDFYIPTPEYVKAQSKNNKQGRAGDLDPDVVAKYIADIDFQSKQAYHRYEQHLEDGVARELGRMELPVNLYTEWYWRFDLHNLMHFLKLRMDPHAQKEIQDYAIAMYNLAKEKFPISMEAFNDYILHSARFSRHELTLLKKMVKSSNLTTPADDKQLLEETGMSRREMNEFLSKLEIITKE